MRKVSLLIAVLLLVSVGAFAQTVDSAVEAEVSAAFGAQLDEMDTGISNSFSVDWSWTLREEATEEFGEGSVYGMIEVEDFEVSVAVDGAADQSGVAGGGTNPIEFSWGDVNGRLVLGAAYIELGMNNVTTSADEASMVTEIGGDIVALATIATAGGATTGINVGTTYDNEDPGVAVGFSVPDMATVELGLISQNDWEENDADGDGTTATGEGANTDNAYMLSLDTEVTPMDMLTLAVVATMEFGDGGTDAEPGTAGNPAGIGVGVEYEMPMSGDMNLVPELGFDFTSEEDAAGDAETRIEVGAGVNILWGGLGLDDDDDDHVDFLAGDEEVTDGVGLGVDYGIHSADLVFGGAGGIDESVNTILVKLGFYEDGGDSGLLPVIGGAFVVNYNMMTGLEDALGAAEDAYSEMGVGAEINADLGVVAPYFGAKYVAEDLSGDFVDADADGETDTNSAMFLNVGTDINVISNVTFNIDYSSGDLLYDKDENAGADATYGDVYGGANSSTAQAGVLAVETTISY